MTRTPRTFQPIPDFAGYVTVGIFMANLSVGTTLKVISIDQSKVVGVDWLNEREPREGDVVLVETISGAEGERIIRLRCEPREGFLEWRIDVCESGLQFEAFFNA